MNTDNTPRMHVDKRIMFAHFIELQELAAELAANTETYPEI